MSSFYRNRLQFAAAALAAAIPGAALLFLLQGLCGFSGSWTWYVAGLLFYSVFVFGNAYFEDKSILFSSQDHRSKLRLLIVHCICMALLLALLQFALYIQPYLPASLLSRGSKARSWLEFLLIALLMAVFFVEENWLAVGRKRPGRKGE
jgi:hypothetical protein